MSAPYVFGFPLCTDCRANMRAGTSIRLLLASLPLLPTITTDAFSPAFVSLIDSRQRI
jgi:hypothetical protein